jgi:hypothetical protein
VLVDPDPSRSSRRPPETLTLQVEERERLAMPSPSVTLISESEPNSASGEPTKRPIRISGWVKRAGA